MRSGWYDDWIWQGLYANRFILTSKFPGEIKDGDSSHTIDMRRYISEYDGKGTSLFLELSVYEDENKRRRISDPQYQKLYEEFTGHFRPVSQEIDLTKSDIDEICELLDSFTISRGDKALPVVLSIAAQKRPTYDGYTYRHSGSEYISFTSDMGGITKLNKRLTQDVLELAFSNSRILHDQNYLLSNQRIFAERNIPLLLCLFSVIDSDDEEGLEKLLPKDVIDGILAEDCLKEQQKIKEQERELEEARETSKAETKLRVRMTHEQCIQVIDSFLDNNTYVPELLFAMKHFDWQKISEIGTRILPILKKCEKANMWPLIAKTFLAQIENCKNQELILSFMNYILSHHHYDYYHQFDLIDEEIKEAAKIYLDSTADLL